MAIVVEEKDTEKQKLDLIRKLEEAGIGIPIEVEIELDKIWKKVEEDAKIFSEATMDTGTLRSTIRTVKIPMGTMLSGWSRIKEMVLFDRAIVAGNIMVTNPKTGKPCDYATWVHDGHALRDGSFWEGNPFLTEALAKNENEIMRAIERALGKIGKKFSN